MKDTIVTARRKKIELITLLVCFVVSNLLHLYAIILRLLFYGMQALFKKKNRS